MSSFMQPLIDRLVMNLQSTLAIFHMWCSSIADLRAPPESAGSLGRAESSAATSSPNVPSRSGSRQPSPMWPGSATTAWNLVRAVGTTYRASLAHRQPDNCEYAKEVEAIYLAHMPTALRRCLCGPHVGENELPMLTTPDQPDVIEKESVAVTADTRLWRCEHTPTWQELVLYRHHLSKLCSSQVVCQFPGLYSTLPQGTCGELMTMRDVTDAFLVRHCPVYQANCSPRMQLIGWKTASCVPSNFQEHFESVKQLVQEKSCSGQSHHSRVSAARSSLSSKESAPPKSNKFSYAWWHPGLLGINDHSVGEQQSVIQYVIDSLRDVECDCLPTADTVILLYSVGKSSLSEPASGKDFKSVCVGCHLISQTCLSELVSKLSGLLNTVTVVGKDPAEGSRSEARDSSNKSQGTNPAVLDVSSCIGVCTVYVLCMYCVCTVYVLCMYCVCTVYVLCMSCVCTVYVLCMYCVCPVYVLCMYCVCPVYVLCMYCVCTVYVLCMSCVCTVYVLCMSCVCTVYVLCMYCVCPVYVLCMYCVCTVYVLCMSCVCTVYVLCMYCVCPVYVLCMYCVCTVYVLCMYCVCTVYALRMYCGRICLVLGAALCALCWCHAI